MKTRNTTHWLRSCLLFSVLILASVCNLLAQADGEEVVVDGSTHSFDELLKIADISTVKYNLTADGNYEELANTDDRRVLNNLLFVVQTDDGPALATPDLGDSTLALFQSGEDAYAFRQYDEALKYYHLAYDSDSGFTHVLAMIGDVHYLEGRYDSAVVYYERGLAVNPASYSFHWFLSNALWELGDTARSVRELTLGHLLNRNHLAMYGLLQHRRSEIGRPWKNWWKEPLVRISEDDAGVLVELEPKWVGYALVKAIWAYEPGYADKMLATCEETVLCRHLREGREALIALATGDTGMEEQLVSIIEAGDADLAILYELLSRETPEFLLILAPETINALVYYIDTYH